MNIVETLGIILSAQTKILDKSKGKGLGNLEGKLQKVKIQTHVFILYLQYNSILINN